MKRLSSLEIAAMIVGVVALTGAIVTIYIFASNNFDVEAIDTSEQRLSPKIEAQATVKNPESFIKSAGVEPREITGTSKAFASDTILITKEVTADIPAPPPVVKETVQAKKEIKKKAEKKSLKEEPKKKPSLERRLKQVELNQLMANVYNLKANNVNRKACVLIRQTANSNVVAGLTDVGRLLQTRGFIIAGRELIPGKVDGIKVRWPRECLTVTIGSVD